MVGDFLERGWGGRKADVGRWVAVSTYVPAMVVGAFSQNWCRGVMGEEVSIGIAELRAAKRAKIVVFDRRNASILTK